MDLKEASRVHAEKVERFTSIFGKNIVYYKRALIFGMDFRLKGDKTFS